MQGFSSCRSKVGAQLSLDHDEWENSRDDYEYADIEKPEPTEESPSTTTPDFNFRDSLPLIRIIVFGIIFALLVFLIYKFILANRSTGNSDENLVFVNDLKEAEENLMKADLDELFRKMIGQEDFRSAIRVQYLQVIQYLSKKGIIRWEKQKTNFDYLNGNQPRRTVV